METKEYIVALNKGVDYDQFWADIENPTTGLAHIPDRSVGIADNLDALDRVTHYFLTAEEAERLEPIMKAQKEEKVSFLRILLLGFSTLGTLGILAHFRH